MKKALALFMIMTMSFAFVACAPGDNVLKTAPGTDIAPDAGDTVDDGVVDDGVNGVGTPVVPDAGTTGTTGTTGAGTTGTTGTTTK